MPPTDFLKGPAWPRLRCVSVGITDIYDTGVSAVVNKEEQEQPMDTRGRLTPTVDHCHRRADSQYVLLT